jgi:hypothetical protein
VAPDTTPLLDHAQLDRFADALRRSAPLVAASMGPGLSEDEIRTVCAQASLEPSRDAITWFTYWDASAERRTRLVEVLPGVQTASLRVCLRNTVVMRQTFRDVLGQPLPQFGFEDAWSTAWLSVFGDGGGTQFVVDCREPERPSIVRDCFREDFTGPDWGKPIAPLATWLGNATGWMTANQSCRFDAGQGRWLPFDAVTQYWPHFDMTRPPNPPIAGSQGQGRTTA